MTTQTDSWIALLDGRRHVRSASGYLQQRLYPGSDMISRRLSEHVEVPDCVIELRGSATLAHADTSSVLTCVYEVALPNSESIATASDPGRDLDFVSDGTFPNMEYSHPDTIFQRKNEVHAVVVGEQTWISERAVPSGRVFWDRWIAVFVL